MFSQIFHWLFSGAVAVATISPTVKTLMSKINRIILNPIIILMFVVATLLLIVGFIEFLANPDNEESRDNAKQHMLWAIIGMFIMISVFGIMQLIIGSLGLTGPTGPIDLHNAQ